MIAALLLAVGVAARPGVAPGPATVVVATSRGELAIPVSRERGHAALPVPPLIRLLPVTATVQGGWAHVGFAGQPFRFLLDGPAVVYDGRVLPLAGGAYLVRDTLFVPLQWLAEQIPGIFREGYRYDPLAARLEEAALTPVVTRVSRPSPPPGAATAAPALPKSAAPPAAARHGLRLRHVVVVDAGHGGDDPGNPGVYLPRGLREKDVTLAIAKLLRADLEERGVGVIMTRTTDTLIALGDRGRMCRGDCDLFISIHVNSVDARSPGFGRASGLETYFLAEARTREAQRVAAMENEAIRYEASSASRSANDPLDFILKDLQTNEYLRESAVLAELIQNAGGPLHPGGDRGVSQAGFMVLATARRPAVLVETGYATNRGDGAYLASSAGQAALARAIADGVVAYLRQYESKLSSGGLGR